MKIKFLRIISSVLTAVTILALFSTAVFAADFTTLIAVDGEVTLDGTNPGTVTVYWRSTGDQNIYAIEGDWSVKELESTNYLTLTEITSDVITFSGFYYTDPGTGKVRWLDDSFENPGVLSDGKNLLSATYEIAADTPAGTYTVQYASVVLVGNDYENDKAPVKPSPKIVVKRSSTPSDPAKPTINVTGTYTYTGSNITATVTGYNSETMNITGNVGKNAGNYTVSVTSKTGKWADGSTAAVTKSWTIAKADPSVTTPTGLAGTKGKALSTVTLPTGWAWKAPTTVMNTLGNQTFAAVYTPADTTNYNTKEANLTVNVSEPPVTDPAKPTINVTGTYTYTGSNITATVTGYNSATMNITGNVGKNAGNYTVSVTSKTGKWADGSTAAVTKSWTIAKADPSVTAPTGLTGTKGKALSTVTLPTGWAWKAPTTVMNTLGNQTFAAVYTPADTTNYNTKEANLTVNVSEPPVTDPAKPTINVTGTYTYTGSNITATVTGYNSATMNITGNVGKNAGNYTVSVTSKTGKWADGSTAAVTKSWTIAKATPTGMPAFTPIVAAGQTLADASLTANFNIPGSIKWIAEDGSELAGTTTVEQNVYYKWQFTPTDADNYEILTGTIRLYSNSTGGGGIAVIWHTVKFDTNGGTAIANKPVIRNTKLAMPTAPTKDGYIFDGWYTDKELKIAYNFDTKVTKNFTLYAKWVKPATPEWKNPFADVKTSDWFYGNVKYASENGLMSGTTNTTFAPNKPLTRGMLVMVLYRADGEPAVNKNMPFADVDANAYYANAVIWAHQNGIVNGVTENTFAPDNNITREQIATIMYRYAKYKGFDVSTGENTNIMSYTDAENVSEYAISAMQYAVGSGLMKGKTESTINPLDNATRAEIAAILQRFFEANK